MVKTYSNKGRESKQSLWFPATKHQWLLNQSQGHFLHHHGTAHYGTCFCCLGPPSPERHQPTRESTATSSQILLRRLHKQNTRMCWWQAKGATLGKPGSEQEEQLPKSPSQHQHQHRSCWHHHRLVPTKEWPHNAGSPAFSTWRTDYPALYHPFYQGTLRQWNRLPIKPISHVHAQRISGLAFVP